MSKMWIVHGHVYEVECILFIYNEYCVSFDSTFCVTTGFWLIIMSSDIVITPKSGLPKGKGSVLTVLGTLKTIAKSLKRAKFSPSLGLVKLKDFQLQGGGLCPPDHQETFLFPKGHWCLECTSIICCGCYIRQLIQEKSG